MEHFQSLVTAEILTAVLVGIAILLGRAGKLSDRAFVDSPQRTGRMGLLDLLVTFGLVIFGQAAAGIVLAILQHRAASAETLDSQAMLVRMLASQAGMLPAAGFILARAAYVVDGGIKGFGFDLARGVASAMTAVRCFVVVYPATMLVSMIMPLLMIWMTGEKPKMLAHDVLPLLRSEPWGPVKWGLIASAVVAAPIMEELLFRGVLQTAIRQSGLVRSRWVAIVGASLVFALIHASVAEWYALPALFTLALGLGYAYERSGSLYAPMLMHATFNAIQITVAMNLPEEDLAARAVHLGIF